MNNPVFLFGIGAFALMMIGLYGVLTHKNIFRLILSLGLMETGVNLFIVAASYWDGVRAPILGKIFNVKTADSYADPLPQALVLTSIVIGLGVTALALALMIKYREGTGTLEMEDKREEEVEE
ncbi:MAG: cation:proton antiporter subunit C [Deltaproteobacteria bacterium]|nr:cation:proton antiporter subunit C [Deltaproteobacteria bacterium]